MLYNQSTFPANTLSTQKYYGEGLASLRSCGNCNFAENICNCKGGFVPGASLYDTCGSCNLMASSCRCEGGFIDRRSRFDELCGNCHLIDTSCRCDGGFVRRDSAWRNKFGWSGFDKYNMNTYSNYNNLAKEAYIARDTYLQKNPLAFGKTYDSTKLVTQTQPVVNKVFEKDVVIQHQEAPEVKHLNLGTEVKTHQNAPIVDVQQTAPIITEKHQNVIHEHHKDIIEERQKNIVHETHQPVIHEVHQPIVEQKHVHEIHQPIIHKKDQDIIIEKDKELIHEQRKNIAENKVGEVIKHEEYQKPVITATEHKAPIITKEKGRTEVIQESRGALVQDNMYRDKALIKEEVHMQKPLVKEEITMKQNVQPLGGQALAGQHVHNEALHTQGLHGAALNKPVHGAGLNQGLHGQGMVTEHKFEEKEIPADQIHYDEYGRPYRKRGLKDKIKGLFGKDRTHTTEYEDHYHA